MNEKTKQTIINTMTHGYQFEMGIVLDDQAHLARYENIPAYMLFWLVEGDERLILDYEGRESSAGETTDKKHFFGAVDMSDICPADDHEEYDAFETEIKSLIESILFHN